MNGIRKLSLLLMLLSLTACASRVQRTVYYEYHPPVSHAAVYTTVHRYQPIEVTVYADRFYRGGFSTIRLVMVDGEYAAIPVRNRNGRDTRIFAHYAAGVLHFDADRNCHGIQGASRFGHDNGWQKGRTYNNVSAGKDYDSRGLRLMVRNVDRANKPTVADNREPGREKAHNVHPSQVDVDRHSSDRERLAKGVQKQTVTAHHGSASQKDPAESADHRVNRVPQESEKQARAINGTPENRTAAARSQALNRSNRGGEHEQRKDALAKLHKVDEEKAANEKGKAAQQGKLTRNESKQAVAQQMSGERDRTHEKPNAPEKPGMTHADKANARHQVDEKEKKPAKEKKLVEKDRQGKKNKDRQDDDEQGDPDDEAAQGKGSNRHAT